MKKIILFFYLCSFSLMYAQVPSYVPINGLVCYYPFNGNANDVSGNGNNGNVNDATLTTDRFGNVNSAYSFNGNSSFIEVADNQALDLTSFTISSWVNIPSVNSFNEILTKGGDLLENYEILIYGNGMVETVCRWTDGSRSGFNSFDGNQGVILNKWTFITATYSIITGKLIMYFNGNFVYEMIPNKIPSINNTNLFIGKDPSNGRHCLGKIDDISIYNRALTQQEIINLFESDSSCQSLVINTGVLSFNPLTYTNTITIYPNPANDHITIDFGNLANVSGWDVKITNMLGQEVFNQPMNTQQYLVPLNSWSGQGVYFVKIYDAQGVLVNTKKIILQ